MKKFFVFSLALIFLLSAGFAYAAGDRHHPTGKRYGYVDLPLTSFVMAQDGASLGTTASVGGASATEADIKLVGGKPAIVLGYGETNILTNFKTPADYWRDGKIEALVDNTTVSETLAWEMYASTATLDTTPDIQTAVALTDGTSEFVTFAPADDAIPETMTEGSVNTFQVGRSTATVIDDTVVIIYGFTFIYEKKTDS